MRIGLSLGQRRLCLRGCGSRVGGLVVLTLLDALGGSVRLDKGASIGRLIVIGGAFIQDELITAIISLAWFGRRGMDTPTGSV